MSQHQYCAPEDGVQSEPSTRRLASPSFSNFWIYLSKRLSRSRTTKSFTSGDWLLWTSFAVVNISKFASTIVTFVYYRAKLEATNLFVQIYKSCSYFTLMVCLIGNVVSVLQRRKVLTRWIRLAERQTAADCPLFKDNADFSNWKISLTKSLTMATYLFAGYYAVYVWNSCVGPTLICLV